VTDQERAAHPKSRGAARRATRRGPTIDDVAASAGVSRGTVSRVLNGGRYVSTAATAAVQRAMVETGYVVNTSARSLVTRRADCVAFVLSEPQDLLFEDPNFNVLLRGCTQQLAERDISLVLMIAGNADQRARVLRYSRSGHVDGVLLVSTHAGDPIVGELVNSNVPTVACGRPLGHESSVVYVTADDREGARQMARHLRDRGSRRIATVTGPLDTPGGLHRLEGFSDVLGRRLSRELIVSADDYTFGSGEKAMAELLARENRIDAVFVASDLLAAGALATLGRHGLQVPADVAVGGFDDSRLARSVDPALTTVRQPFPRIAEEMVAAILRLVRGQPVESVVLPTELVLRDSA
jgi:DNA-binding LacI/PurR family transcriptional regulator